MTSLLTTSTELRLIDAHRLLVHPVILRDGKHMFRPGRPPVAIHLSTRTFSPGVDVNTYRPTIPRSPVGPNATSITNG
jgi:hypothetical protein